MLRFTFSFFVTQVGAVVVAALGALLGAALGALLGATLGALLGASLGALLGAILGAIQPFSAPSTQAENSTPAGWRVLARIVGGWGRSSAGTVRLRRSDIG